MAKDEKPGEVVVGGLALTDDPLCLRQQAFGRLRLEAAAEGLRLAKERPRLLCPRPNRSRDLDGLLGEALGVR